MWNLEDTQLLLQQTGTDKDLGLDSREAQRRLTADGFNQLREEEKKTLWKAFLEQINDPLIYVLLAAGVISLLLHEAADAAVILAVVLLNAVVGLMQETRAQKALDALKKLSGPHARVIRDGKQMQIPASMLVKGDLVCLEAGMQVPADIRLLSVWDFMTEESALTGESIPVQKNTQYRDTTIIGDRTYMAYMSTTVAGGRGIGVVTATGMDTEVGKIADMIAENESEPTPLQLRLEELGKVLSLLSLGVCAALFVIAILQKRPLMSMLLTAISLAVAAVPEGLAAVVTLCLALSVTRMVKAGTIVRRLPCVETLGSVNVVCSDKTGTLTQNRMTVMECMADAEWIPLHKLTLSGHEELFWGMVLCCDAVLDQEEGVGDPTELALLEFGAKYGIDKTELEKKMLMHIDYEGDLDQSVAEREMEEPRTTVGSIVRAAEASERELPEGYTADELSFGELQTISPVLGYLNSGFGYRDHPVNGKFSFHSGADISANAGDKIAAFADGVVEYVGEDSTYGLYLQLDHGNEIKSFYAHCQSVCVKKGQTVKMGDTVAIVGSSGRATGPHLHLELKCCGVRVDPAYYIDFL